MVVGLSYVVFIVKELDSVDGMFKVRNVVCYCWDVLFFVLENNRGYNYVSCIEKKNII